MGFAIMIMILSAAVSAAFMFRDVPFDKYTSNVTRGQSDIVNETTGEKLTSYEAWLQYSIMSDSFSARNREGFDSATIKLSDFNSKRIEKLDRVYRASRVLIFVSVILLVFGFLVVRRRRMYDCVVWGGLAGTVIGIIFILLVWIGKGDFFGGIKAMAFKHDYLVFFNGDDYLRDILPDRMGINMFTAFAVVLIVGFLVTLIVRIVSMRKSEPHRFR